MRVHAVMRDLPPLAHTGGFGEPTCVQCHMDGELNEPGGTVTITGLPPRYQPGQRYTLRISVSHPELRAAGFELSARYESGPDSTRQAGTLAVDGDGAQVSIDGVTRARSCLRAGHERPERGEVGAEIVRWSIVEYYRPTA